MGSNSSRELRGTIRTLVGATRAGSDSTCIEGLSDERSIQLMNNDAHPSLFILFSAPKVVFQQSVQDTPETKGRFNDVRSIFTN